MNLLPRTRPIRSLMAGALLAAALAGSGFANPVTDHFDDLIDDLNGRDAGLPDPTPKELKGERKALDRAFRALAKDSSDAGGDLKIAKKMTVALEKGYPADESMALLLDGLYDGLDGEVEKAGQEVADLVAILEDGSPKTKAAARHAAAEGILLSSRGAGTRKLRATLLLKAWKGYAKAGKIAGQGEVEVPPAGGSVTALLNGTPWATNGLFGAPVIGNVSGRNANDGVRSVVVIGRRFIPHTDPPPDSPGPYPGAQQTVEIRITGTSTDITTGTWTIGGGGGVTVSAVFIEEDQDGNANLWLATSGSVTLTDLTMNLGSGTAAGTFGFSLFDGISQTTRTLGQGAFTAEGLVRVSKQ